MLVGFCATLKFKCAYVKSENCYKIIIKSSKIIIKLKLIHHTTQVTIIVSSLSVLRCICLCLALHAVLTWQLV
jgi:hypothetical protein